MSAANRRSAAARHSGSDQRQEHALPLRLSETIPTTVTGLSSFSLPVWRLGAGEPWIPAPSHVRVSRSMVLPMPCLAVNAALISAIGTLKGGLEAGSSMSFNF